MRTQNSLIGFLVFITGPSGLITNTDYRIHSNQRTCSNKRTPLGELLTEIQPFLCRNSTIFTKMAITQPKIVRFSIRNNRWKAENELDQFLVLYKRTVRLLERIRYVRLNTDILITS